MKKNTGTTSLKILIVEDDPISMMYLTHMLQTEGRQIFKAGTGTQAVQFCNDNPGLSLILMDINLPEMDGLTATRKIREFNKDVVIIMQTALELNLEENPEFNAGWNEYIRKPLDPDKLNALINKHLG